MTVPPKLSCLFAMNSSAWFYHLLWFRAAYNNIQPFLGFQFSQVSQNDPNFIFVSSLIMHTPNIEFCWNECKVQDHKRNLVCWPHIWRNLCGTIDMEIILSISFYCIYQNNFLWTNRVFSLWFYPVDLNTLQVFNKYLLNWFESNPHNGFNNKQTKT